MELLDRVTKKGNRSRFIDQAIRELALGRTRTRLRKLLEEEGRVNRDRDLRLAAEWAAVDAGDMAGSSTAVARPRRGDSANFAR